VVLAWACVAPAFAQGATEYNASVRPDPQGVPTRVSIGLFVLDLVAIDDLKQEFTVDLMINVRWNDPRLATPEPATEERILQLAEVWNPVVGILNRRDVDLLLPQTVRVDSAGHVVYRQRLFGQFASPLDLHRFPADEQDLAIRGASYRYGPEAVEFVADSARTGRLAKMSVAGWNIGQPAIEVMALEIPGNVRAGVVLSLKAGRETGYYTLTMVVPLVLIALMAWAVFWIDPTLLPPQVSVATASVFALIAFRFSLSLQLPRVSYLTMADWFVLGMTLLVFGAFGETVLAGRLAKMERVDQARRIDNVGRWVYMGALILVYVVTMT
jgi:hypothetical protein